MSVASPDDFVFDAAHEAAFKWVIPERAWPYIDTVLQVARETGISPLLIVGFMERESASGQALLPPGPAGTGDSGHGRGLMQIDDRSFGSWLAANNWRDPAVNIRKGVAVLQENLQFFQRKGFGKVAVEEGTYAARQGVPVGVYADPRPLSGVALWMAAVAGYNTGERNVLRAIAAGQPADHTTANHNYATDILTRVGAWEEQLKRSRFLAPV